MKARVDLRRRTGGTMDEIGALFHSDEGFILETSASPCFPWRLAYHNRHPVDLIRGSQEPAMLSCRKRRSQFFLMIRTFRLES